MPRDRYQPRNGDRVQRRLSGQAGEIIRCFSRVKRSFYFRVKFDNGTWDWPNDVIAESSGRWIVKCQECDIDYRTEAPNGNGFCPNCLQRLNLEEQAKRANPSISGALSRNSRYGPRYSREYHEQNKPNMSTATVEQKTEPKHPDGCLCGTTRDCTPF